jgi:hypothetical protein
MYPLYGDGTEGLILCHYCCSVIYLILLCTQPFCGAEAITKSHENPRSCQSFNSPMFASTCLGYCDYFGGRGRGLAFGTKIHTNKSFSYREIPKIILTRSARLNYSIHFEYVSRGISSLPVIMV